MVAEQRVRSEANVLDADELRLYDLIWKRTMASQMPDARVLKTTVELTAEDGAGGLLVSHNEGRLMRVAPDGRVTTLLDTTAIRVNLADFGYAPELEPGDERHREVGVAAGPQRAALGHEQEVVEGLPDEHRLYVGHIPGSFAKSFCLSSE